MLENNGNMKIDSSKGGFGTSRTAGKDKPTKDFRKILAKEEKDERPSAGDEEKVKDTKETKGKERFEDIVENLEKEPMPSKTGVSLFELASTKGQGEVDDALVFHEEEDDIPITQFSEEVHHESLSALFKGYGSQEKLKALQEEVLAKSSIPQEEQMVKTATPKASSEDVTITPKLSPHMTPPKVYGMEEGQELQEPMEDFISTTSGTFPTEEQGILKEKERFTSKFAHEQPDLAATNPLVGTQVVPILHTSPVQEPTPPPSHAAQLKEIVDQIIAKLYTINTSGRTDTLIALKHPPLFAGANVVISAFESARGEFNITFENLTQAAKQLLDLQENQNALKLALDQKGYTVHIITTTTLFESIAVSQDTTRRQDGENQGQERGGKREENEGQEQDK